MTPDEAAAMTDEEIAAEVNALRGLLRDADDAYLRVAAQRNAILGALDVLGNEQHRRQREAA